MKKFFSLLALLLFLLGLGLVCYPLIQGALGDSRQQQAIADFRQQRQTEVEQGKETEDKGAGDTEEAGEATGETTGVEKTADELAGTDAADKAAEAENYRQLLEQMESYNQKIYQEKQQSLCDAWSYTQNVFDFPAFGLEDDMIGYLTIEAMDLELPLYIGANYDNMTKGGAVLAQTSMPIGGENTNCVIAAHRGWRGEAMFRDIEVLKPGDVVKLTNLWEELYYQVEKTIAIRPEDIDAVKILEGRDMVTLITCHPYTHNYQRYVVYCARSDGPSIEGQAVDNRTKEENQEQKNEIPFDGVAYQSSAGAIKREKLLTWIGIGILVLLLVVLLFLLIKKWTGKKGKRRKRMRRRQKRVKRKADHIKERTEE